MPRSTAVEMVAPDLEIPGSMATACATPTVKAFLKLTFFEVFCARSANNSKSPVMISIAPTKTILFENKDSNSVSKKTPIKAAGSIEIIILKMN